MNIAAIFETLDYGPAPEGAAPANLWLDAHGRKFGQYIDGKFTKPGKTFASENPANGDKLADITDGSKADVDKAVKAARAAFPGWSGLSGFERAKYLYAIARLIQKESRLFAVLETLDNGKPIRESRDSDIPLAARHFYHHAGWAQHIERSFPDQVPYGVCGQIIPWNFPLLMLAWKIAPALAAGNTVVLKPAEFTSLTALLFAEICVKAGLPDGVVNIITGAGETGAAMVDHPDIDKIAFTGSTEVGKIIRAATAGSGKGLSLELGGKSPYIVFDDADIDSAIEGLVDAIWFNQGQVCCAGSRLLVQEGIEERFLKKLKLRMDKLRVGDPLDKSIDIGAMIAPVQVKRVQDLLAIGRKEGGTIYEANGDMPNQGCYLKPILVTDVSPAHTLVTEEIFGPVLVAMSFRTPDEAVALANNTKYGLAATVWSENINLALDIAPRIKAGVVWVNCSNAFDAAAGFGGYKESGFGREGGREGMSVYLKPAWEKKLKPAAPQKAIAEAGSYESSGIDQTAKMYIGGKQARGDSGYARTVLAPNGSAVGEVCDGNRKDIRNAVEAARKALGWGGTTGHLRSQILYFLGENLSYRKAEFADRIRMMTGVSATAAKREVDLSVERLFAFAGWADKYDGAVHNVPMRAVAMAMVEPMGVIGIAAPNESPLLAATAMLAPAVAMGNTVVLVPSEAHPLSMTDLYQVMETSDVPAGVINVVTGDNPALARVLAEHDGVDALWFAGAADWSAEMEKASIGNLKTVWTSRGMAIDWADKAVMEGDYFLSRATQVKNIWVPYGA
ncbi:aldehyde dehydrogenase family protein [Mariluticola halotolerans]|uniref:aldehyde dehydrogenase family protein n=1 Tax=Mariluticola halotolerans TaxID=2909283 RepID=UPI0026E1A55E|nr:aldehyde dehydrogenase family protein [Mariluticola halotolerans]UJQ93173.1 aldehyde dehydrogenase family protein [Mariluticola halotolerans]